MKVYGGVRLADGRCRVLVILKDSRRIGSLPPRLDLANRSPTGFEWGYAGSGPAQLALAILADALHDDEKALRLHQRFKWQVIAQLDRDAPWAISIHEVLQFVRECEADVADITAD